MSFCSKRFSALNPKIFHFRVALEKSKLEAQKIESDETVASLQSELAATRDLLSQSKSDTETEKSNFENFKNESIKTVANLETQLAESKNELVKVKFEVIDWRKDGRPWTISDRSE